MPSCRTVFFCLCLVAFSPALSAAFLVEFDGAALEADPAARDGWAWMSGDGTVEMSFTQADGRGIVEVDSTPDRRNIWWAVVRRSVSPFIDPAELARPDRELRVEAKVRGSSAPRRVNLHFNHSRTTDFHSHLMEYDLPDTENWRLISMTTTGFDALPGDEVFVQLALMDWGRDRFRLEIDYLRVDLVDPADAAPDHGPPLPYHPDPTPPGTLAHAVPAAQAAMVDSAWPDVNFNRWASAAKHPVIGVGGTKTVVLRFDFGSLAGGQPGGWGTLALTMDRVYRAETGLKDFGLLRVTEVLAGDPEWDASSVTWNSFLAGNTASETLNGQMMIDIEPNPEPGGITLIPVSPPVLQRLLSGRTKGLAIRPLGAVEAAFRSGDAARGAPTLHFDTIPERDRQEENR